MPADRRLVYAQDKPIIRISALAVSAEHTTEYDEQILIEVAQREPEAFGPLYERHVARVYRYVRARSSTNEEAADLTQQVFVRALDRLPGYRHRGTPFAAWLLRIARNMIVDVRRRHRITVQWDHLPEVLQPECERNVEDLVLRNEALDQLRRLLIELTPEKRELIVLRFVAGLTAREIAVVVGKREAAVQRQLARILHTLKEQYHGE